MDLLEACESLAANIYDVDEQDTHDAHVSDIDLQRWQNVFSFTRSEAREEINRWRGDFGRETLSITAWEVIKDAKIKEGFDKESYEYSISRERHLSQKKALNKSKSDGSTFLVKLDDYLSSPATVRNLLGNDSQPTMLPGADFNGSPVYFCSITGAEKLKLAEALHKAHAHYQPTFVRVSIASKDLSPTTCYPTLGIDTTLPQYRPNTTDVDVTAVSPQQNELPVWYFFYGTLADREVLSRVIGVNSLAVIYKSAQVSRGRLSNWGGKYLGLVDADASAFVHGWAYQVKSRDEEEALRIYESDKYMVVRCQITMNIGSTAVKGLTFRLVSDAA